MSFLLPGSPRPLGRQRPTAWQLLGRQNLTVWWKLERQSLILWLRATLSDNPIWKACSILRQMLWRRKEETAFPSYLPVGWHCPPNALGILMYLLHLLTGNMSLATLLSPPHQASTTREESTLMSTPAAPTPSPGAKCPHLPNQMSSSPLLEDAGETNDESPCLKWKGGTSFMVSLKGDW